MSSLSVKRVEIVPSIFMSDFLGILKSVCFLTYGLFNVRVSSSDYKV